MAYKISTPKAKEQKNSYEKPRYNIIFDDGKPYEVSVKGEIELKKELQKFYLKNKDNDGYYDASVFNEKNEDISESQFVEEIIGDILEE
jgi:hypothetical protein